MSALRRGEDDTGMLSAVGEGYDAIAILKKSMNLFPQ